MESNDEYWQDYEIDVGVMRDCDSSFCGDQYGSCPGQWNN
jgi:hypothetical protein